MRRIFFFENVLASLSKCGVSFRRREGYAADVMPPAFETDRAARVRRNPWIMGLAALPFAIVLGEILVAIVFRMPQALVLVFHMLALGTFLTIFAWRKNKFPREVPGKLVANERGLSFGGNLFVPKNAIKSGLLFPRPDGRPVLRFRRRGLHLSLDIRVTDREEGRSVLRALGLDASQSVVTFSLPSMILADPDKRLRYGGLFGTGVVMSVLFSIFLMQSFPAMAVVLPFLVVGSGMLGVLAVSLPTRLQVGADGIHLKWFRTSRFFGYGDIASIHPYEDSTGGKNALIGLMLTLTSGEMVRIPVMSKSSGVRDDLYMLHERISEAIETWTRGEGVAHAALLRRAGRATPQWVRALRGIGAFANVDARTAPVVPEKLWRIVEDPAAPADARAGAAVALSQSTDNLGRARLRAAASATAVPKLRIAIETAASSEDEEVLAAALSEVESEDHRKQRA